MANLVQTENMIDDNYNDTKTVMSCESPTPECDAAVPNGHAAMTFCSVDDCTISPRQVFSSEHREQTVAEQCSSNCTSTDNCISCSTMPLAETIPCDIRRSPSPAQDAIEFLHGNVMASTPVAGDNCPTRCSSSLSDSTSISVLDSENDLSSVVTTMSHTLCGRVEVPIMGYEILEERSKFTVSAVPFLCFS